MITLGELELYKSNRGTFTLTNKGTTPWVIHRVETSPDVRTLWLDFPKELPDNFSLELEYEIIPTSPGDNTATIVFQGYSGDGTPHDETIQLIYIGVLSWRQICVVELSGFQVLRNYVILRVQHSEVPPEYSIFLWGTRSLFIGEPGGLFDLNDTVKYWVFKLHKPQVSLPDENLRLLFLSDGVLHVSDIQGWTG